MTLGLTPAAARGRVALVGEVVVHELSTQRRHVDLLRTSSDLCPAR